MKEVRGNLWTYPTQIRVITTNGFVKNDGTCVMGRGCAREARDMFPGISNELGRLIRLHGNRPFAFHSIGVATMPVKHSWWEEADLDLIAKSARQLMDMADKFKWTDVLIPRPGCGNGRLSWSEVGPVLSDILDDRFSIITF